MIAAFDPGKGGGVAYWDGEIFSLHKFTTESDYLEILESFDRKTKVYVEDVPVFVAASTSNASSFKLGYNFGFIIGACRAFAFPVELVPPKKWQKGLPGLKPKMPYAQRKRVLKDNAVRMYPALKGVTNATSDALLVLDYAIKVRKALHM
jgi:hypothetical protein